MALVDSDKYSLKKREGSAAASQLLAKLSKTRSSAKGGWSRAGGSQGQKIHFLSLDYGVIRGRIINNY